MKNKNGWIEVITGCMFAGKTEELIRRIRRLSFAKKKIIIFKSYLDKRYSEDKIITHIGDKVEAVTVKNSFEISLVVRKFDPEVIAIDELHFFDFKLIFLLDKYANEGKQVIVAGLDMDIFANPFQITAFLLARAEKVTKLTAVCLVCKKTATRTQYLEIDKLTTRDKINNIILPGGKEIYQPRCRKDHIF